MFSECIHRPSEDGFACKIWESSPMNAGKSEKCKKCRYYYPNTKFSFLGGIVIWSIILGGAGLMLYTFSKLIILGTTYYHGGF